MCGLFGVITHSMSQQETNVFKELMVVSSLRGTHSTGVGVIHKHHNSARFYGDVAKAVGNPFNLMETKHFDNVMNTGSKHVAMGHCRYATRGAHSKANAHPFVTEHIIGAHNGTINAGLIHEGNYGTDSECLINMLDELGVHEAIPKVTGAWALTWFDFRNNSFNVLRNDERPLHFIMNKQKTTMFYASEFEMLDLVAARSNIVFDDEMLFFSKDALYSFDMTAGVDWYKSMEVKAVKGKEVPPVVIRDSKDAPFHDYYQRETKPEVKTSEVKTNTGTGGTSVATTTPNTTPTKTKWCTHTKSGHKTGFKHIYMSNHYYNELIAQGCSWCGNGLTEDDKFVWMNPSEWLCEDCTKDPAIVEALAMYSAEIAELAQVTIN